ncbi:MAG TPA: helix-turn-helix transcriptional regulator [Candidatus Collinsella stercoripullorum]|nr:helix-turn-helix transcriptional regulator [Candidatus Collinsella stercoripullorum]
MKTADHIDRAASTADGLAGRLSERRRARGLTQGQVAVRLGVSRQAVSKWEMGGIT